MNNNRNNNRRRGRGNRNQGGVNAGNRIDSRARGNAPQLLDKYKKLAQDAQHNGDRVQAEYYLQFADHYFRVIADNKARQEEMRAKRPDGREQSGEGDDDADGGDDRRGRRRPQNTSRGGDNGGQAVQSGAEQGEDGPRGARVRAARPARNSAQATATEPAAEPTPRPRRKPAAKPALKTTRTRRPSRDDDSAEIDAAVLPPAISVDPVNSAADTSADGVAARSGAEETAPPAKPKPRRRRKPSDDGDTAQAAG